MMTKPDGSKCTSTKENLEIHKKHHEDLLNTLSEIDESVLEWLSQRPVIEVLARVPTESEVLKALAKLNNSTPGASGVPAVI